MSRLDDLYLASPIWLQQVMVAGWGMWWRRRRFGPDFERLVEEFRSHERWSARQFTEYQTARLAQVLHAARQAPFYRPRFEAAGLTEAMTPWEMLARLPILSKQELRAHAVDLLTAPSPREAVTFRSSGTTGTPTEIFYTREFHSVETASIEARNLNWAGATYRDRRLMFGARKICRFDQDRPPFWRYSPAENLAYASVYHLSPKFLPAYVELLETFKPDVVMGYPSALYPLAEYAIEHGLRLPAVRGVFTSAEPLADYMREAIETAWDTRIFDRYGAVEGCVSASQCEHGRYHVNPEIGVLEILDNDGRPVPPGVEGEVVCTGLYNVLQPLIRYRIGDYARWASDQTCACGRQFPIIEGIDGRIEDACYTADGRRIIRFDTVFKGVANIRQAQVVQERLDAFSILVDAAEGFGDSDVDRLRENMRLHVGAVDVTVRRVDTIARTAAGKFRAVVCLLTDEDKRRLRAEAAAAVSHR